MNPETNGVLFSPLLDVDYRASRPLHRHITRIIRNLRQAPTKNPFRILRTGINTTTGRRFSIIVVPVCGVNSNSRSHELTQPSAGRLHPAAALPPLRGKETALRQIGESPAGVSHASTRLPHAS